MNLAVKYLQRNKETLSDYDGYCGELVDGLIHWLGEDRVSILYISNGDFSIPLDDGSYWGYHMVAVVDGRVHDAWFPEHILPPEEYLEAAFPQQELQHEITGSGDGLVESLLSASLGSRAIR